MLGVIWPKEGIGLVVEDSLIIHVGEGAAYVIPIYSTHTGEIVNIGNVIVIVDVKRAESIVTDGADSILGLSATEGNVTEIETDGKGRRIVQSIVISAKIRRRRANVINNMTCHGMALPHILDADSDACILGIWRELCVELHIHLEESILVAVISPLLKRMNYNNVNTKLAAEIENRRHLRHKLGGILIKSAAEWRVSLNESYAVLGGKLFQHFESFVAVLALEIVMSAVKSQIEAIVARLAERAGAMFESASRGNKVGAGGNQHKTVLQDL